MIIAPDVPQGSLEWLRLRLGVLTASDAGKLLTKTRKLSSQREGLIDRLVAEKLLGEPVDDFGGSYWTERGEALEAEALAYFELMTGHQVKTVSHIYRDDSRQAGCSPDGLVIHDGEIVGGVELKCPKATTHVGYLRRSDGAAGYDYQVQCSLWVTGLPQWWFQSYYPGLDPVLRRITPDPDWQAAFDEHVPVFLNEVTDAINKLT